MFTIEPLFEFEEPPARFYDYEPDPNLIMLDDGRAKCAYCGDISQNEYCHNISHSRVFNGWCSTRLLMNHGANPDQLAWLDAHGWTVVDPHEECWHNVD